MMSGHCFQKLSLASRFGLFLQGIFLTFSAMVGSAFSAQQQGETAAAIPLGSSVPAPVSLNTVTGLNSSFSELIARCAPTVHPETMSAVISAESKGHQFAIADAGPVHLPWTQRKHMVRSHYLGSLELSISKAEELIAAGHTVSLGLSQINDRNLKGLGLSVRDVFDPCVNVAAGGKILTSFYQRASRAFGPGPAALRAAISGYNSGSWVRGEKDGYVDLVYKQVGKPLAIQTGVIVPRLKASDTKLTSAQKNGTGQPVAHAAVKIRSEFSMTVKSFVTD